jgi:hypothetical protein
MDGGSGFGAVETPSLARMLDTWTLAVLGEMDSSLAMCRWPRPAATSRSTSISHSARPNRDGIPGKASAAGSCRDRGPRLPALCAAGSYGDRPEPIPFLRILAVSDREDVRGEHRPLT